MISRAENRDILVVAYGVVDRVHLAAVVVGHLRDVSATLVFVPSKRLLEAPLLCDHAADEWHAGEVGVLGGEVTLEDEIALQEHIADHLHHVGLQIV